MNALSADFGYRGAAAAGAVAALLISTDWVRRLPSRAPLIRIVSGGLLGGAAIAAVAAAVDPGWEGPAAIAATALTTAAVLISTDLERAAELLAGVASIGIGVAAIGSAVALMHGGQVLGGILAIWVGVVVIGMGFMTLRRSGMMFGGPVLGRGVATIGAGIAFIGCAVLFFLRYGHVLAGVAYVGVGVAWIGGGVAILCRTRVFVLAVARLASLTRDPSEKALEYDGPPPPPV